MRINLISSLNEDSLIEEVFTPTQVYAWFLRKAFVENDIDARLINEAAILEVSPPKADHTIVISVAAFMLMMREAGYAQRLKGSTAGKLARYMNVDRLKRKGDRFFDLCFVQIAPAPNDEKYVWAGWGVDPTYSYPEQDGRAVFLDSKVLASYAMRRAKEVYRIYDQMLPKASVKIYNPIPIYNESERLSYPEYQSILRRCHYFLCTQYGDGGLNRLEAAACGALLVVPWRLYKERTMRLLNHQVWHSAEDLMEILQSDVDIESNRKQALEHRWEDVIRRMVKSLEE